MGRLVKPKPRRQVDDTSDPKLNTEHGLHRPALPQDAKDLVLGNEYTDIVTGIRGIADGVYIFLTGCDQVSLNYLKDGDAKHIVVDASRIKELRKAHPSRPVIAKAHGGPARVSAPGSRALI